MPAKEITQNKKIQTKAEKEKENKLQIGQVENKQQLSNFKPNHVSHHIKCKWSVHPN